MFLPLDKWLLSRRRSTPVLVACLCREQRKKLWEPVPALKVWQRKYELVLLVDLAVGINSKTVSKNFYSFLPCFKETVKYINTSLWFQEEAQENSLSAAGA